MNLLTAGLGSLLLAAAGRPSPAAEVTVSAAASLTDGSRGGRVPLRAALRRQDPLQLRGLQHPGAPDPGRGARGPLPVGGRGRRWTLSSGGGSCSEPGPARASCRTPSWSSSPRTARSAISSPPDLGRRPRVRGSRSRSPGSVPAGIYAERYLGPGTLDAGHRPGDSDRERPSRPRGRGVGQRGRGHRLPDGCPDLPEGPDRLRGPRRAGPQTSPTRLPRRPGKAARRTRPFDSSDLESPAGLASSAGTASYADPRPIASGRKNGRSSASRSASRPWRR